MLENSKVSIALALARIGLGLTFMWAFFDKLLGLGFATCKDRATGEYIGILCERSFIQGGKVTTGFLSGSTGPFSTFFKLIAGNTAVEWLFMIGLICIGLCLTLGIAMRLSAYSASIMLFLMWTAELPKSSNPFLDEHLIYIPLLLLMIWMQAGKTYGLGKWWESLGIVQKFKILQ